MTKRLLILDDDKDILDVMKEIFIDEGYEVKTIENGDNILSDVISYRPDIILLDYILHGINGGELCHQIKTNEATCTIPIIIVTAYSKVINSLGHYGCDSFVSKPFDITELVQQVNELLNCPKIA
ncbi:two-component system response regulator [Mucilaginibacter sp.]|jgi:DNA-binding response OmpR family regulator|uniref:response regulator n=1 Tax=Mucilaginibacter sp. TaxID=1882438 RepID=UPI003566369E